MDRLLRMAALGLAAVLASTGCSRSSKEAVQGAQARPPVTLEGYKGIPWGASAQTVLDAIGIDEFSPIEVFDDRLERWASPQTAQPACSLFCGPALHQAFAVWYGAPTTVKVGKITTTHPEIPAPICPDCQVRKAGRYDEYVTFDKDQLVAYWFPLSISDWDRARSIVENRYGPPSAALQTMTVSVTSAGDEEGTPFTYEGALWFGPSTTIYAVTEQYSTEAAIYKLGYIFYVSSLFDMRNVQRIRATLAHREEEKRKAASRDEDFVKAVIE